MVVNVNNFTLWQRRVKDVLTQQGLAKALKGKDEKLAKMNDDEGEELEERGVSTIRLYVVDNILNDVIDEDFVPKMWKKLEKFYLAKNLTNKLHLKQQLYQLKMAGSTNLMEHINVCKGLLDQL